MNGHCSLGEDRAGIRLHRRDTMNAPCQENGKECFMHKKNGRILFLIFVGLWAAHVFAQANNGRIIDVFGKNVTIRMDSPLTIKAGDKVDLSYLADTMEFLVGQYEVVQMKGNVFIAKEISSIMPPSQEMKVRIVGSAANMSISEQKPAPSPVVPIQGAQSNPGATPQRPVKVEVLGPDDGVDPSAPPAGRAAPGQSVPPRADSHGRPQDPLLGVPMPKGQQKTDSSFDEFFRINPSQSKEITFKEYKRLLAKEYSNSAEKPSVDQNGRIIRPRIGISVRANESPVGQAFPGAPMGIRVVRVTPGSPADKSGLEVADILYAIDNTRITSADMFIKYIQTAVEKVYLNIQRDGKLLRKVVALQRN
jgi:hypothetical protein